MVRTLREAQQMITQRRPNGRQAFGLVWALLVIDVHVQAQPCSITIDNDTTICQGQTVTLHGPPGFPNYLWSNGAVTQNTTVGTSGNYTCQVTYPTGNLVTNGNFSSGNTGFSTQFNYNNTLTTDGNYWIGSKAGMALLVPDPASMPRPDLHDQLSSHVVGGDQSADPRLVREQQLDGGRSDPSQCTGHLANALHIMDSTGGCDKR